MLRLEMPRLHKINVNLLTVFQYAFILCIILNFRSIWLHTESLAWTARIVKLLMGLSVMGGIFAKRKASARKLSTCLNAMGFVILYGVFWYLADVLKSSSIITVIIQLLTIAVYCLLVEDSVDDTMRKYTNVVLVIAVVSLFFWVFGSILGYIRPTGVLYTTWTGNDSLKRANSYYGVYFETQSLTFFGLIADKIVRNTSIFTEAPMASMIFCIAFLNELLIRDKLDWKRCLILIVAVISTVSTTGYTIMIIAVSLRYILTRSKTKGRFSLKLIFLPMVFGVALVALNFLIEQRLLGSSGSTRIDDFIAGYKAWMDAPLFGNGYGNSAAYKHYMSSFRSNNLGFSNSPMQILAYGGIYLFLPYCVTAVCGLIKLAGEKLWRRTAFYIVFLYAFVITICPFQMLTFYIFISMAREGQRTVISQP